MQRLFWSNNQKISLSSSFFSFSIPWFWIRESKRYGIISFQSLLHFSAGLIIQRSFLKISELKFYALSVNCVEQLLPIGRRKASSKPTITVARVFYIIITGLQLDSLGFVTLLLLVPLSMFSIITLLFLDNMGKIQWLHLIQNNSHCSFLNCNAFYFIFS